MLSEREALEELNKDPKHRWRYYFIPDSLIHELAVERDLYPEDVLFIADRLFPNARSVEGCSLVRMYEEETYLLAFPK